MELTRLYRYQSEAEARAAYCLKLLRFLGIREGSAEHQQILDDYNTLAKRPEGLPRGWKALPSDAWCAIFAAGQAHAMGMTEVYPMECSCARIIEIAEEKGIWIEADDYIPARGDWCIFAWEAPSGENKAKPDHIGTVYFSDGEILITVEGNKSDTVATRAMTVGDKRIRGFVHPDYSQLIGNLIAPESKEVAMEVLEGVPVYDRVDEVPEYGRATVSKLIEHDWLKGVAPDALGLTDDLLRTLVILDRAGAFDNS